MPVGPGKFRVKTYPSGAKVRLHFTPGGKMNEAKKLAKAILLKIDKILIKKNRPMTDEEVLKMYDAIPTIMKSEIDRPTAQWWCDCLAKAKSLDSEPSAYCAKEWYGDKTFSKCYTNKIGKGQEHYGAKDYQGYGKIQTDIMEDAETTVTG